LIKKGFLLPVEKVELVEVLELHRHIDISANELAKKVEGSSGLRTQFQVKGH
jgi:hypothetical protein